MAETTGTISELVKAWEDTFNHDIERMVHELYAPDALLSGVVMGPEKFLRFERRVLAAAPRRAIRVVRSHSTEQGVVIEGELVNPDQGDDWKLPFCAVLGVDGGRIVSDNTYADFSRWPGMR